MKTKLATLLILLTAFAMPAVADDVDKWIQDLKDPSPSVREAAAENLGNLGSTRAVGPLIQALSDTDSAVRGWAVYSLGKLNDTRAVHPLILALGDTASNVRISKTHAQ
jgi:HEAT repeat protein